VSCLRYFSRHDEPSSNELWSVVRNMMATPDGDLVLACSGVNRVAMVDVK
jgi:hypothetical protein